MMVVDVVEDDAGGSVMFVMVGGILKWCMDQLVGVSDGSNTINGTDLEWWLNLSSIELCEPL